MSGPFKIMVGKDWTALGSTDFLVVEASIRLKPGTTEDEAEALAASLNDELAQGALSVSDKVEQSK